MSASHNVKKSETRSYRFSGYQFKRDHDNNIVKELDPSIQPEYWKTRSMTYGYGYGINRIKTR